MTEAMGFTKVPFGMRAGHGRPTATSRRLHPSIPCALSYRHSNARRSGRCHESTTRCVLGHAELIKLLEQVDRRSVDVLAHGQSTAQMLHFPDADRGCAA